MTEKLTRITLPGRTAFRGLMDWGELTPAQMIAQARVHARHLRSEAEAIERAADADFQVDVVRGSVVQRYVKTLQHAQKEDA